MRTFVVFALAILPILAATAPLSAQSINVDFGDPENGPPPTYGAAGLAGVWNSFPALHTDVETDLLGLDGVPTPVWLRQLGGMENLLVDDPAIDGTDAILMEDFVVTYSATLESCIFFSGLEPGEYEVLIYARMPDPEVMSYTDIDQEAGNPHTEVGGEWSGGHQELVSYSRHLVTVGTDGILNLHSGVVPLADPALGAALNGVQLILLDVFSDGFESGDVSAWTVSDHRR